MKNLVKRASKIRPLFRRDSATSFTRCAIDSSEVKVDAKFTRLLFGHASVFLNSFNSDQTLTLSERLIPATVDERLEPPATGFQTSHEATALGPQAVSGRVSVTIPACHFLRSDNEKGVIVFRDVISGLSNGVGVIPSHCENKSLWRWGEAILFRPCFQDFCDNLFSTCFRLVFRDLDHNISKSAFHSTTRFLTRASLC